MLPNETGFLIQNGLYFIKMWALLEIFINKNMSRSI